MLFSAQATDCVFLTSIVILQNLGKPILSIASSSDYKEDIVKLDRVELAEFVK